MAKTIDLPSEVYEQLEKQAQMHNLTIPEMIARLIEEVEAAHLSAVMERLRSEGLFAERSEVDASLFVDFQPVTVHGKPLSEVIIEERR
ncbi:MAG: hypothetical protein ABI977_18125 [Acidobacteriota bacterium]